MNRENKRVSPKGWSYVMDTELNTVAVTNDVHTVNNRRKYQEQSQ